MSYLNMGHINVKHQTHFEVAIKFLLLLCILIAYFAYLWWKFDAATGFIVAGLTWSFFVLCTPVADAGFLLDFPIRLFFGLRMVLTEIMVWAIALLTSIVTLILAPEFFEKTLITSLFYKIITQPFPYWGVIVLCGVGTFLSVYLGDEMLDVLKHKNRTQHHKHGFKYKLFAMSVIIILIIVVYHHLLQELGMVGI